MEYVHMDQPIRKPVLDTLLTTEAALSRVPFPAIMNGVNGGFRPMTVPNFPSSKSASAPVTPNQLGTSSPGDPATSVGLHAYLGAHFQNLVQGARGVGQLPNQGELLSGSLLVDGVADRGKKTREGGRGSRGGGGSRKRTRASPPEDAAGLQNSVDGGGMHLTTPPGRGGNGGRQRTSAGDKTEKADKGSCRKQSSQASKRGEKKGAQFVATVSGDVQPKSGAQSMSSNAPRPGLFDIYGLKTKPVDISHYVTDLSLSELVLRSSQPPVKPSKAPEAKRADNEIPFDQQISHLLPFLPPFSKLSGYSSPLPNRPTAEAAAAKAGDTAGQTKLVGKARPHRLLFDLESRVEAQDNDSFTRMMDPDSEQNNHCDRDHLAAPLGGALKDGLVERGGSEEMLQKASMQNGRGFVVEDLKLCSVEEFMTRLQLAPSSDSLCSLISQVSSYQGDFALHGGYSTAIENRTRSIPPQPYSQPSVGLMRFDAELERGSKLGKTVHRPWRRCEAQGIDGRQQKGYGQAGPVDLQELGVGNGPSLKDLETANRQRQGCTPTAPSAREQSGLQMAGRVEPEQQFACKGEIAVSMEVEAREGSALVLHENGNVLAHSRASATRNSGDRVVSNAVGGLPLRSGLGDMTRGQNRIKTEQGIQDMDAEDQGGLAADARLGDADVGVTNGETLRSEEVARPKSPRAELAASILMDMLKSNEPWECPTVMVNRRRPFQSYSGAPTQRAAKSMRIGQLVGGTGATSGHGQSEGREGLDGGNVPPNKALVSEKRKSLSQVTETSQGIAKASLPLPSRGTAWGLRGSVGSAGGRVNGWAKGINKVAGRAPASAPAAAVSPAAAGPSKGSNSPPSAVKGALRTKLCKGAAAAKAPTPQKVGPAKSSKASMSLHSLAPVPGPQSSSVKANRQSMLLSSEGKKTKRESRK